MAKQKLTIDLKSLFPGETVKIGDQSVYIQPLGLKQLAVISTKLKGILSIFSESGITLENYNEPQNLMMMAAILLNQFPEVLEEASNIEIESLEALPLELIIEILNAVIDVNLKSKEGLEGNFKSLMGKFDLLQAKTQEK